MCRLSDTAEIGSIYPAPGYSKHAQVSCPHKCQSIQLPCIISAILDHEVLRLIPAMAYAISSIPLLVLA